MPAFETTRRVAFTPTQMFNLVADVESYPKFFPLCEALRVKNRSRDGDVEILVAEMVVGYKAIREAIVTRVTIDRPNMAVRVDLVEGPFRQLENRWFFAPAAGGSDVRFGIAYEFNSMMLQLVVGAVFDQAFRRCVEAFEARAREVYGTNAGTSAVASR